jgi:hypothetical protein
MVPLQWADIKTTCAKSRLSRSTILRIVSDPANGIRHFLLRSDPLHEHGKKLIHWGDFTAFIQRQAEEAQRSAGELPRALEE